MAVIFWGDCMGGYGQIAIVDVSPENAQYFSRSIGSILNVMPHDSKVGKFADGEVNVKVGQSVRGKDVYIFQSYQEPIGERLYELQNAVSATRGEAERVNAVLPYCFGMRGERPTKERESVQLEVVVRTLYSMGIKKIITVGLHTDAVITIFKVVGEKEGIKVEHLSFNALAANYIINDAKEKGYDSVVLGGPDVGSSKMVDDISIIISQNSSLKTDLAIGQKRRLSKDKVEIVNIIGDVKGKQVYSIDDAFDTGGSKRKFVEKCIAYGAHEVTPIAIHPVCGKGFEENLGMLVQNPHVPEIVFGDTIPIKGSALANSKVKILPLEPFVAEAIRRVNANKSMSELHQYSEIVKLYKESKLEFNPKHVVVGKPAKLLETVN